MHRSAPWASIASSATARACWPWPSRLNKGPPARSLSVACGWRRDLRHRALHGTRPLPASDARINGEPFALDQAGVHAGSHHRLEHVAQDVAIAEAPMAIDRERRMIGHRIVEIEPAEPSVGQMQLDLLAQPPLKADAVAVAHHQHP